VNDRLLLLVLAGVFAVLAALLVVLGLFVTPVAALVALPFAGVALLLWYHATGRLEKRARTRTREAGGQSAAAGARGGRSARARAARERSGNANDQRQRNANGQRQRTRQRERQRNRPRTDTSGMSVKRARKVLAVETGADEAELRAAYRERVKEVHPDRGGSEEEFRQVQQAYNRLRERDN